MMKKTKKILSALLAMILLSSTFLFAIPASAATTYKTGDIIEFGTYPQTRVEETTALKNAANAATWKSYNYYSGTGNQFDGKMSPGDYMKYADFVCNGSKYRVVTLYYYRPETTGGVLSINSSVFSGQYDFQLSQNYYFRYEPLEWRVLNPSTGLIVCEQIIDSQAFHNTSCLLNDIYWQTASKTAYANDYSVSSMRNWLNSDFYSTAFSNSQKSNIKVTELNNDSYASIVFGSSSMYSGIYDSTYTYKATKDRVFLLSYLDVINSIYGFSTESETSLTRQAKGTDYAKCQGLWVEKLEGETYNNSYWWLRTPQSSSNAVCVIGYEGKIWGTVSNYVSWGVRPACCLKSIASDTTPSTPSSIITDPVTGIEIGYDDGALRPGTTLSVRELMETAEYADTSFGRITGWDLHLVIGPDTTQPLKAITLKLPIPNGYDKNRVAVYHETNSKTHTLEKVKNVTVDGNFVSFSASSFSVYLVVEESNANLCKYCGKEHTGFFGKIVAFFHNILFRIFGAKK